MHYQVWLFSRFWSLIKSYHLDRYILMFARRKQNTRNSQSHWSTITEIFKHFLILFNTKKRKKKECRTDQLARKSNIFRDQLHLEGTEFIRRCLFFLKKIPGWISGAAGVSFFVLYQLISVTMKTQFEKINRLENKMKKICSMENLLRFCSKLYCVVLIFLRML